MDKRILVTGGAGFLGAAFTKNLLNRGYQVTVYDNAFRGRFDKFEEIKHSLRLIEGDIRDADLVLKAAEGHDIIVHMAAVNGTKYFYEAPHLVLDVMVKGTINTIEACRIHGIKRYILASSSEVYQQPTKIPTDEMERIIIPDVKNPRFTYSGGKIIGELLAIHYAKEYGFSPTIFRPHNFYGPDMGYEHVIPEVTLRMKSLSDNFKKKTIDFPIQGTGEETRAFCYVDDGIDGIRICMEKGEAGEIYHIGKMEEITIKELILQIGVSLGLTLNIQPGELREGGTSRRCPDIAKLAALGYEPKVTLQEGLKKTCEWYLAH